MPLNAPYGFRPVRHLAGGDPNRSNGYPIASGYSTAIYSGDPVKLLSDGSIALAAAGERIVGIFQGVRFVNSSGEQKFEKSWTASTTATDIMAAVVDDPLVLFQAQFDGTVAQSIVGELTDHVAGTGSALTGQSGAYLNSSSSNAAASFRIRGVSQGPDDLGSKGKVEVQIHEHEFSIAVAGTPGV